MRLETLESRHSVRSFSSEALSESETAAIKAAVTAVNTFEAGMHFKLVTDSPEAFSGFGRSYGIFKGVRNYIALAVDSASCDFAGEKAGYYAQMLVMMCVNMGLGTCIVGGTFSRRHVDVRLRAGWSLPAVIAVGHVAEDTKESVMARLTRRLAKRGSKTPMQFLDTDSDLGCLTKHFPNLTDALKAVAAAPSALNRQPVKIAFAKRDRDSGAEHEYTAISRELMAAEAEDRRFLLSPLVSALAPALDFDNEWRIDASVTDKEQLIDLGVAMWNFEQIMPGYWIWGNPARFIPLL